MKKKILIICICMLVLLFVPLLLFIISHAGIMLIPNNLENEEVNNSLNENIKQNLVTNTTQENLKDTIAEIKIYDIEEGYLTVPYNNKVKKHKYNWNNLSKKNSYYKYNDEIYESKFGIDVSEFQGNINWKKVKESGVEFAFVRLGYRGYGNAGNIVKDRKFAQNVEQANQNNIKIGIYFFSQAINTKEAIEEAKYVINNIKDKNITYPICFDLEKIKFDTARTDNLTSEEITQITIAFCDEIKKAGYRPLIYGNSKTFTTRMQLEMLDDYEKWYADYLATPLYPYDFSFWQYSEKGKVNGIDTNVDLNLQFILKD